MRKNQYCTTITAISMLVGSVIGSGVFFKAETINKVTKGNIIQGAAAWLVGGMVMIVCLLNFSKICGHIGRDDGLCGYASETVGPRYAYYVGWFMASIYYPVMVSVLSQMSASYTMAFLGTENPSAQMSAILSCVFIVWSFALNAFFRNISERFQLVTTFLKLAPLVLMIAFGTIKETGNVSLTKEFMGDEKQKWAFLSAVTASAFAYEGWINATNMASRLKNGKKTLPKVLIVGGCIVLGVYVLYHIGVSRAAGAGAFVDSSSEGVRIAYRNLLGRRGGDILMGFVAISCIGALNAMMYGCIRALYNLSQSGKGPAPKLFSKLVTEKQVPLASAIAEVIMSVMWLFFAYGTKYAPQSLAHRLCFDSSELPVVTSYAVYIPIFIMFCKKYTGEGKFKMAVLTGVGVSVCSFMIIAAIFSHGNDVANYLLVISSIMLYGAVFE